MTPSQPTTYNSQLYLYGPSGSGKSTVGRILADALNLPLVDLDAEIETQSGMSIPDIFSAEGELGFRARETQALRGIVGTEVRGIALGGGR